MQGASQAVYVCCRVPTVQAACRAVTTEGGVHSAEGDALGVGVPRARGVCMAQGVRGLAVPRTLVWGVCSWLAAKFRTAPSQQLPVAAVHTAGSAKPQSSCSDSALH